VLDNGLSRGREWGFGEVIFSGNVGYVARYPMQLHTGAAISAYGVNYAQFLSR
jgi:hypothetical protein